MENTKEKEKKTHEDKFLCYSQMLKLWRCKVVLYEA